MALIRATFRVDVQLSAGVWTSLATDLSAAEAFTFRRGMGGSNPQDNVATTGVLQFGLKNDAQTGGPRLEGWYSPNHANARSGFTFGIATRVVATYSGTDYTLWRGRLHTIDPLAGKYGPLRVRCVAYDAMRDFAEAEIRGVANQTDVSETACLTAIVGAMPADARPQATSFDTALETFPYALDNVSGGTVAMTAIVDVMDSCRGYAFIEADGTFRYKSRYTWANATSDFTFDDTMFDRDGLEVPSDLANVYNDVSVVAHPKTLVASSVLCGIQGPQLVKASETITLFLDYADADNKSRLIGGRAFTTPLVENTDYDARANKDGSGADLSGDLTITATGSAGSAKFVVQNTGSTDAYLVNGSGTPLLQLRGTAIFDNGPETRNSVSTKSYGVRRLEIDLPYQDDGEFADNVAIFVRTQYEDLSDQAESAAFDPQRTDALMKEALGSEIGEVKTISETITGLSDVDVQIVAIEMEISRGDYLRTRYRTAPVAPFKQWQLGTAGASEIGESTALGY